MRFPQEKIHIHEYDGIDPVAFFQMPQRRRRAYRVLHLFAAAESGADAAEAALERASDAGLIGSGPLAEVGALQVLLCRNTMKWNDGECVRTLHGALAIVMMFAGFVF